MSLVTSLHVAISFFESGDESALLSEKTFNDADTHILVHNAAKFIRGTLTSARGLTYEDTKYSYVDLESIAKLLLLDNPSDAASYVEWFSFNDGFQTIKVQITPLAG